MRWRKSTGNSPGEGFPRALWREGAGRSSKNGNRKGSIMPRLSKSPDTGVATLAELVGIANALEHEAERRYRWLAEEFRRRGEPETAEAFEGMAGEEEHHIVDVSRWADNLGQPVPAAESFFWRLPSDLAESWDEVAGSALLTPYRAFAIAVDNEERAFAFYAYVSAWAEDRKIAAEAEMLAREELRHAAKLRTQRRIAYRAEGRHRSTPELDDIQTEAALARLIVEEEAEIAEMFAAMADRLDDLGAAGSADDVRRMAEKAKTRAAVDEVKSSPDDMPPVPNSAAGIMTTAQARLERFSERLESVLIAAEDEKIMSLAQSSLEDVVRRIALINDRLERSDEV
ncbi:ferritin-like domain-containing protein [Minwuia thermotolerans]|uniref:ferritin-like domain-containing protein n=1 Tax=Minwuia thermotolerans TaxID=2056226 RepID=UPI0019D3093D|nr:ferritin family protein [Minwuia thermotolerans]